jgi:hypothetical protein
MSHVQVVKPYLPAAAIANWPQSAVAATDFALQYGLKDDLAPPDLSEQLEGQLKQKGLDLQVKEATEAGVCAAMALWPCCLSVRKLYAARELYAAAAMQ